MKRSLFLSFLLLYSVSTGAETRFISPQDGGQVVGPTLLEVSTTLRPVDRVEFRVDGVLAGVARTAPFRAIYDFGDSLTEHAITAEVFAGGYRQRESALVTTAPLSASASITVDLVELPLKVTAARPLSASDVSVTENGVRQKIRDIRPTRGPASFVFVVDRSLSMSGGKLQAALRAIGRRLPSLRRDDSARIILFNHRVDPARPISSPGDLAALSSVPPSGGTSLRDALSSIPPGGSTIAIVITDGADRNSETGEEEALRKISRSNLTLYALSLGSSSRFLDLASQQSGGRLVTTDRDSLDDALDRIFSEINSRYLVVYQSSNSGTGWRDVAITSSRGGIAVSPSSRRYYSR